MNRFIYQPNKKLSEIREINLSQENIIEPIHKNISLRMTVHEALDLSVRASNCFKESDIYYTIT